MIAMEIDREYAKYSDFLKAELAERVRFETELRKFLVWKALERDSSLAITEEQRRDKRKIETNRK